MNILKKIYCRIFQTCFRIALPVLPYREPELIDGFKHVPEVLKKHHISHILLVTDPGVYKLGLTKPLEKQLLKSEISCTIYKDTVANPTSANIEESKDFYLAHGCQALLAFGGGSSMDCAKAVGARLARPHKSLSKMEGILKIWHRLPLLIAVPTTAGTGSETTLAAVITDADTHHKYAINDFNLIPDYAVLEPSVTYGLPPQLTATTGMDALTHAIEAYIGRSTTKQTRAASIEAIQLIFDNLQTAYKNGNDKTARRNMLRASYLAGTAFTKSYVGYVHAVAHSLGGQYGIPHGLANSVLLPIVLEAYGNAAHKKLAHLARITKLSSSPDDTTAANAFIAHIRKMNASMNIPTTLAGIRDEDIPKLARYADKEANPLYPVPILWDDKQLALMYHLVQEKKEKENNSHAETGHRDYTGISA
mgnify:CR=1 FL=1